MKRNRRRKRKVFDPSQLPREKPRLTAGGLIRTWAGWGFAAGVAAAMALIGTLFLRWQLPNWVWIYVWPPSSSLMTSTGLTPRRELLLAYLLAIENGAIFAAIAAVLGIFHLLFRGMGYTKKLTD